MLTKKLVTAGVAAAIAAGAIGVVQAEEGQFIPALTYRTGPYAPGGIPTANGYTDYFHLINQRDGGVNGVKFIVEECEYGYKTDRGVECYDRLKDKHGGATAVSPYSTGTTYALIDKATADKVPILSATGED